MQSNNPVFNRSEGFNGRGAATTRSADPSQWKIDLDGSASQPSPTHTTGRGTGFMTIESTVEKTALTLGVVVATAAAAWFLIGDISTDQAAVQKAFGFAFELATGNSPTDRIPPGGNGQYVERTGYFTSSR